jgi:formate/nitrite transporter
MSEAHSPREIAQLVARLGEAKVRTDALTLAALAVLGGAFIALGALFFTTVVTGSTLGFGATRLLGGVGFSLGLILVVVAGAELFTGNNLLAIAWASRAVTLREVIRHWLVVYAGNVVGALGTAALAAWAGVASLAAGGVGDTAVGIAAAKASLGFGAAFARGVLCNALVCLAVWLALGGRSVADKVLAIVFPISAFVAIGFEHSIANWFFLPYGIWLDGARAIPLEGAARNLVATSLGNLLGGTLLVAAVYWVAYLRDSTARRAAA